MSGTGRSKSLLHSAQLVHVTCDGGTTDSLLVVLLVRHACELTADIPQPASSGIVQRKPARLNCSASHYVLAMYLYTRTPIQSQM